MALTDQTRLQLIIRVADKLHDVVETTATANGSTTTWLDTIVVNSGAESYDGCELYFTSGDNDELTSRVTTTTPSTGTLTFTPARTSTVAADTAILVNRRNRGFTIQEYRRAVNEAIEELNGIALIPTIETIGTAFDADTGTIAMPATLFRAYRVEYLDSDSKYREVKRARRGGEGWTAEAANAVIRVEGSEILGEIDGYTIRVHGYKRASALTSDTDVCSFDGNSVVMLAAYRLCMAGLDRDSRFANMAITLGKEAEMAKSRARTIPVPGTVAVRI